MFDNIEDVRKLGNEARTSMMPGQSGGTFCVDCANTGEASDARW
jgi:hypothetical protein